MPKRATPPSPADDPVAAAQQGQQAAPATAPSEHQRPERAERLVQARREVMAPDAGVGRVVDDAEVGPAVLQALGVRQRDRAEAGRPAAAGCRRRSGCAGTSSRRRAAPARTTRRRRPSGVPRGASTTTATLSAAAIASTVDLGPGGEADREPGGGERPAERHRRGPARGTALGRSRLPPSAAPGGALA